MASSYLITTHTPGTPYIEIWNLSRKTRVDGYLYLSYPAKRFSKHWYLCNIPHWTLAHGWNDVIIWHFMRTNSNGYISYWYSTVLGISGFKFKFKYKCFIFPTEVHDIIYILYVVRFWREGGQRGIAYRAVHLNTKTQIHEYCKLSISQSNIKWYWKRHEKEEGESLLRLRVRTQKRHTTPRPFGRAVGCPLWVLCREYIARYRECTVLWAERRRTTVTPTMHSPSGSELAESDDKFGLTAIDRLHGIFHEG